MEELVKYLASYLVEKPDEIELTSTDDNGTVVLHLTVADSDVGKVIGKNGKIAQSLRTILKSASSKTGKKYVLKIN